MDDDALMAAVDRLYTDHDYKLNDLTHSNAGMGAEGVYGEITTPETLFKALELSSTDHFVDLGSGRGQLVLAAALRTAGPVPTSSIGIELAENRHVRASVRVWQPLLRGRDQNGHRCKSSTAQPGKVGPFAEWTFQWDWSTIYYTELSWHMAACALLVDAAVRRQR